MKTCKKCGIEKQNQDFAYHRTNIDKLSGHCKKCAHAWHMEHLRKKRNNVDDHEQKKKKDREKYHSLKLGLKYKHTKDCRKKSSEKYNNKYPEKQSCKRFCRDIKPITKGNQLHHWSYNKVDAKDVIELSVRHHKKLHRYLVYDTELFMYRRIDTNELLNTRELHEAYMFDVISNKPD